MAAEALLRAAGGMLLLSGWVLIIFFGLWLYIDVRRAPREVLGARIFMNLEKFLRGFLLLSVGFLTVLLSALPNAMGVPGGVYFSFGGTTAWFVTTALSLFLIFQAVHVPRSIRKKFGASAKT